MQRLWIQTGTETVEERWIPNRCQKCNPIPEYSEETKRLIAEAKEANRRRDIEEMMSLFQAAERESKRPDPCCGVCPGIVGGGYDCTCRGNPRCPNYQEGVNDE